jgi:hypothetical protein
VASLEDEAPLDCMNKVPFVEGTVVINSDFGVALEDVRQWLEGVGSSG